MAYKYGDIKQNVDWETLRENEDWFNATLEVFKANHGQYPDAKDWAEDPILKKYEGDTINDKLVDYGLKQMAGFNYDLGEMVIDTYNITNSTQEQKEAFVYMLDQYDEVNTSWHTAKQAGLEMASDITNWIGLATFGTGTAISAASKITGKHALRHALKEAIEAGSEKAAQTAAKVGIKSSAQKIGALATVEGAVHGGYSMHLDQVVRMDAGTQEEYDYGKTFTGIGIGGAFGGTLAVGLDAAVMKLSGKALQKRVDDELAKDTAQIEKNRKDAQDIHNRRMSKEEFEANNPTVKAQNEKDQAELDIKIEKAREAQKKVDPDAPVAKGKRKRYKNRAKDFWRNPRRIIARMRNDPDSLVKTVSEFERAGYDNPKDVQVVGGAVNEARQTVANQITKMQKILDNTPRLKPEVRKTLQNEIKELSETFVRLDGLADHVNSWKGRYLQDIQTYLDFVAVKEGKKGKEITEEVRRQAYHDFYTKKQNRITQKFNRAIDEQLAKGDTAEAFKIMKRRDNFRNKMEEAILENDPDIVRTKDGWYNKIGESAVELSIAGRFSPTTVAVNTFFPFIKTWTYPILGQLLTSPLSRAAWRRTGKMYSYMLANTRASLQAANNAFKWERTTLTEEPSKFLYGNTKTKGRVAAWYRAIIRSMSSTDALMQDFVAVGELAFDSFDKLLEEAAEKGLKGKAAKKYIDSRMPEEIDKGYKYQVDHNSISPIVDKGKSLGLKGEELEKFVMRELDDVLSYEPKPDEIAKFEQMGKDQGLSGKKLQKYVDERINNKKLRPLRTLQNDDAVGAVKDLLYKREFSNKNIFESSAGWIEGKLQKRWEFRFLGNLFFRTPVRLFEESVRISPVFNSLLPNFQRDIQGMNGVKRQARAQTEAAISHFILLFSLSKWAEGELTGSPDKNWHNTMEYERTDKQEPMKINLFGKDREYRWADPFRIPLMTLANTMDNIRYNQLRKREDYDLERMLQQDGLQLEDSERQSEDLANRALAIAFSSILSAFKDSGMTQGLNDLVKTGVRIGGFLDDPEAKDQEKGMEVFRDFLVKKLLMPLPNTVTKTMRSVGGQDILTEPLTPRQRFISVFQPNAPIVPFKSDFFGNFRTYDQPMVAVNPLAGATKKDRKKGLSPRQEKVQNFIGRLEEAGYGTFNRPKRRDPAFGDTDLRTLYTNVNGAKIPVTKAIDMYMAYYYADDLADKIMPYIDNPNLPITRADAENKNSGPIANIKRYRREYLELSFLAVVENTPELLAKYRYKESVQDRKKLLLAQIEQDRNE